MFTVLIIMCPLVVREPVLECIIENDPRGPTITKEECLERRKHSANVFYSQFKDKYTVMIYCVQKEGKKT